MRADAKFALRDEGKSISETVIRLGLSRQHVAKIRGVDRRK